MPLHTSRLESEAIIVSIGKALHCDISFCVLQLVRYTIVSAMLARYDDRCLRKTNVLALSRDFLDINISLWVAHSESGALFS